MRLFINICAKPSSPIRGLLISVLFLAVLGGPSRLWAQTKVLIYYGSLNPENITFMTNLTGILTPLGAQVTSINVTTVGYCPTADNWGMYNQVWDIRVDSVSACPPTSTVDNFTACWQSQAVTYLESGGNIYFAGEWDDFNPKNDTIGSFLLAIGAVGAGYSVCPSPNGNALDPTSATLPCNIPGQAGPTDFVGELVGGIPVQYLNGSNFVSDPVVSDWTDGVNRSIVSGWNGSQGQMASLTGTVGNLVTVWDSNTLIPPFFSGATQTINTNFIQAIYCFLGGGICAPTSTPTFTPTSTPTNTPTVTPTITPTSTATNSPTVTLTITPTPTATDTPTLTPTPTPTCVTYVWPDPYNPRKAFNGTLRISCMSAQTTVGIYTISGELVQTLDQSTACQVPDMWGMVYCWNGRNKQGSPVATGVYLYVVERNNQVIQRGKFLMVNGT